MSKHLTGKEAMLNNHDLKPVEPARRVWGKWNYVAFWLSDSLNLNTLQIVSTSVIAGLTWWEAWLTVWIGYVIVGVFITLSGRIGATYHIGLPVLIRSSFGTWGSLWVVFNRGAMACVWYGVQAWLGGQCVVLMLRAIAPSYKNIHNGIPDSGTTTVDFVGFFIFWLISCLFLYPPVHKIRWLFTVKAIIVPPAGLLFFVWVVVKAKGLGPIVHQPATIHGSVRAWQWVAGIMSSLSNFATLVLNDSDFTRFARKPSDTYWTQALTIPLGFAAASFVGVIVSSASTVIYGEPIWAPLDLLGRFLENANGAARAGVFFLAASFALAAIGINVAANSISAGSDLTALMPKFLNIRRGQYVCAAVGLLIQPWNFFKSSSTFTSYLSSYSTFLSSIIGVMLCDYYIVRKGYFDINALYKGDKGTPYYYRMGVNWRAYVAYILGIVINVVGFAGSVGADVPLAATHMYNLNFFLGLIVSGASYYILCRISPVPACGVSWCAEVDTDAIEGLVTYDSTSKSDNIAVAEKPVTTIV
ncbi:uracil permease [Savitreella phatthalungensis]